MEPDDVVHDRRGGLLQPEFPGRGLAEAGRRRRRRRQNGHARDHESDQPLEHQHCLYALPRREIRPRIRPLFAAHRRHDVRLGPAEHGVLPRAWQLLRCGGTGGNPGLSNHNSGLAAMHLMPDRRPCDKRLAPSRVGTPHLGHGQAAWMGRRSRRRPLALCLTGWPGMTQRKRIKCAARAAIRRARRAARSASACQGIERWAFSGMAGVRLGAGHGSRRWRCRLACSACRAEQAFAQGAVKSVHKDWQIRCDTPPGAKSRAMRADPERDRGRPRQCRPDRDRAQDRRRQEPADAGGGPARRAAAVRPGAQDRSVPTSAAPASCAACPMAASPRWSWTTS